jgi:acetyl-CoA dehydrogenase-like protein
MDLVGRKLGQGGGANFRAFLGDVHGFVTAHAEHPVLGADVKRLGEAADALGMVAAHFLAWLGERRTAMVPLAANRFLEMMAETALAWLLLDSARIALDAAAKLEADHPDRAFYEGKKQAALYFARNVLPGVFMKAKVLASEDTSCLDIAEPSF